MAETADLAMPDEKPEESPGCEVTPARSAILFVSLTFGLSRLLYSVCAIAAAHVKLANGDALLWKDAAGRLDNILITSFFSDSGWYERLMREGYPRTTDFVTQQTTLPFFPLYSLVVRLLGSSVLAGVLVSFTASIVAIYLLFRIVESMGGTEAAKRTVLLLSFFPSVFFLSCFRPEGIFLLLTVGPFYFARRRRWPLYAVCGVLAALTRQLGFLVGVFALTPFIDEWRMPKAQELPKAIVWAAAPATGLVALSAYQWTLTGNPIAWWAASAPWGRTTGWPLQFLWNYIRAPYVVGYYGWDLGPLNIFALGVLIAGVVFLVRGKHWGLLIYTLLGAAPALMNSSPAGFNRYFLVLFPVFMALGLHVSERRFAYLLATFAVLLGAVSVLIGLSVHAVMS
jgi:hypothetical protein